MFANVTDVLCKNIVGKYHGTTVHSTSYGLNNAGDEDLMQQGRNLSFFSYFNSNNHQKKQKNKAHGRMENKGVEVRGAEADWLREARRKQGNTGGRCKQRDRLQGEGQAGGGLKCPPHQPSIINDYYRRWINRQEGGQNRLC